MKEQPPLDVQAMRALCEAAPASIVMVDTGNGHLGYGSSSEEPSWECEAFYDAARTALPAALDRIEALEREVEALTKLVEDASASLDHAGWHKAAGRVRDRLNDIKREGGVK